MKKWMLLSTFGFFFFSLQTYADIPDERMKQALESGCSLVEVKIISEQIIPEKYVSLTSYCLEIIKPLVLGDFEPDQLNRAQFSTRGQIPKI
jgi:hypothetical protein